MTKRIEELLNLDEASSSKKTMRPIDEELAAKAQEIKSVEDSLATISETTKNLPQIAELNDLDDRELDNLATKAEQAYDDLMDLGMNVEVRYAGRIFEVAGSMMKNAIDAKSAKIEKKLKAVDLQLKKYKLDKDSQDDPNNVLNGEGYIITDRNELLKKLGHR
jgi:molybdopterin converting factor small subunit